MAKMGKLIVIDGLDGSGKSTQFELVQQSLSEQGIAVKAISFPDYSQPSSALVKMYLAGEFSKNAEDINAYAASSFYAVDRYASYKTFWESNYLNSEIILASRYTTSNAIHQMVKLPKNEWDNYLTWLYDYEYKKLGLPIANMVIFLDMPIEISQELLSKRYNGNEDKKDIHEANISYLLKCREAALYSAEKLEWVVIPCSNLNKPLSVEIIKAKILNEISKILQK